MSTEKDIQTPYGETDLKGLLPKQERIIPALTSGEAGEKMALIIGKHRFYNQLYLELVSAKNTRDGRLKNPLTKVSPAEQLWKTDEPDRIKFFSAVLHFQNNYTEERSAADFEALRAVGKNPSNFRVFLHDAAASSNITASSVTPASLKVLKPDLRLTVHKTEEFYEVTGRLTIGGKTHGLENIQVKLHYFIQQEDVLYLIDNPYFLHVITFFKRHQGRLVVPHEEFEDFQEQVLSKLEQKVKVTHSYMKSATPKQLRDTGFDLDNERLLYLSESEDFVLLTPVLRYANVEIPVLSQKQIRAKDRLGKVFTVARDEDAELQFITDIVRQHPYFSEQMTDFETTNPLIDMDCFYLHRRYFADPSWFLQAFESWRNKGIVILGFNELKENKLNAYQADIQINVISGIDWFETAVKIRYGKQLVSLKHLHKSIRNKSKFVQLGDGTIGVLPEEWIGRFTDFFQAGELVDEVIRTARINFAKVAELYEEFIADDGLKEELDTLQLRLSTAQHIEPIPIPVGLKTTLRDYQKEGLYWLNFLDQYNFGACLADDMGLGKTVQILAFILSQREKSHQNINLIVVPASLVFNWQAEIQKFAPTLKVKTLYGAERVKIAMDFDEYEVVLTSYGTLLSDIRHLKEYRFNYIFLDESQNIKNPDSQRYKAAKLLRSRNKVVMTGTPVENNTFDLYGQLSFACPGLLGSLQQFRELYSVPIDQFKDSRRAAELQKRISPFILRRTKEQVATELPDKTEMVIYCQMGAEQREIYDAYTKEIRDYLLGMGEDDLPKSSMHVLQGITKLRQICDAPALLSDAKYFGSESAKMEVLLEQIETRSQQHKILVFSQFVGMLDLIRAELENRGIGFSYLTGQTTKRGDVVGTFQNDPARRVFLISLKAGGVGLNLTEADYVYLVDPWWNPAVENQAIDRTYRIGQHKNVMALRLICPDTIEEKIMQIQDAKRSLSGDLIRTEESIFKSLSKNDLIHLLS